MRTYLQRSSRRTGPTLLSYVWCSACHHYAGSTGPFPEGMELEDPLSAADHRALDNDLGKLLEHLDGLWDAGRL